ncbi:SatD family (SatD) [Pseudarcicella hirudinis]|uniref:SatD family (SatD) n=1 Tax=Pseudarcicella hirudinis TaxID=1079859 RepID=A0A1I5P9U0_9BACT|nr:SatD family protein [Pseudarcicella hirudinis]SFP30743.1 SatD family (SatD) [Pseudarcicella hirudinis]
MEQKEKLILMADVIGSRKVDQRQLMSDFQEVVSAVNKEEKMNFLSPMTITLGDEFQSVLKDLGSALSVILKIEERLVKEKKSFKLRYVLIEGDIDTKLNRKIAHGMLGTGLTLARESLAAMKTHKNRFYFNIKDKEKNQVLNQLFFILKELVDYWNVEKDYYIVSKFLEHKDYKQVAFELDKERSLIWKRKKSLKIDEYFALKEVILYLGK